VLAQHAQRVIAVDPASLDERALLPGVTHLACKAEDAVEQIHAMVGQAGVDLLVSGGALLFAAAGGGDFGGGGGSGGGGGGASKCWHLAELEMP
jgi:hypothetical protein